MSCALSSVTISTNKIKNCHFPEDNDLLCSCGIYFKCVCHRKRDPSSVGLLVFLFCCFFYFNFFPTQFECLRTVKVTSTPFCFAINMSLSSEERSLETLTSALNNCIAYIALLEKNLFVRQLRVK